jgi:two-component system sensor histidine kinase RpfC
MVRSAIAALSGALGSLRARLAARPDTEHEQAIVRLLIGALLVLYLLPGSQGPAHALILYVGGTHFALASLVLLSVLGSRQRSSLRRVVAMFGDYSTITCYMALFGERAAPLFIVYVWMTLANGFRFGKPYLLFSLALGSVGFSVVIAASDFWRSHLGMAYGLLIGLVMLSLYVQSLVTKLFDALARAEAANQEKRRFISLVSHELRTPLNAIIGMADLMRETPLNREQADMLQTLRGSSRVMLGLVEEVLDFSKIEAGKLVIEKTDFDLHALVNSTCRMLAAQAAARGIEFVVSIMPEVPPAVRGDPHHLRQILINLAGNAVKFTERGSVTVHVSALGETESGVRLKFSIRDTGIGIPAEAHARIFDSFAQADQSTTRRFGGTGLGTTIAKQLVSLMGGQIGLESAVGLGSTFWFELNFDKQPERSEAGVGELTGERILLVGFPSAQGEAFELALHGWGASPVAVASVDEGVQRMVEEISLAKPYHSVLVYAADGHLARAEQMARAVPQPAPPMVLAVPGDTNVPRFQALSSGFSAVLELPFDKRRLFNVLHSVAAGDDVREGVVQLRDYMQRAADGSRYRILVADDNPTNREVIGKILERGGHNVTLVSDGGLALDALERGRFDLVILDRNMPGTGGIEALQALRLMAAGTARIPVVILSADATPDAKREAMDAGADAFLAKPIEAIRLLDQVQALCGGAAEKAAPRAAEPVKPLRAAAAAPIVNAETLTQLESLGSSPLFIERLVHVFLADGVGLLGRAERALAGLNYPEFRAVLHAIKGSSASMGTDRLTQTCTSFGKLSAAEVRLQSAGLLRSLSEEIEAARVELERYVQERRKTAG